MAIISPYEKQGWDPGTPITQDRMNHIEEGIFAKGTELNNVNTELASLQADYSTTKSNLSQGLTSKVDASTVTDMINTAIGQTAIDAINSDTGTYGVGGNIGESSTPAKAGDIIKQLALKVQGASSDSTQGATAFSQLVTAGALTNNGSIVGDGLKGLFTEIRDAIGYNSETGNLAFNKTNPINLAVSTASKNASEALRAIGEINALGQGYTDNNLAGRLYDYGKKLETLEQAATYAGGEGTTLAILLSSFRTEITNARTSSIVRYTDPSTGTIGDKTFDSVDSRLENIEELILGNSNKDPAVVGLSEKVTNLTPINSLTSSSTTQPLAAAQGPAITNLISAAETAAEEYADNYKVAQADIIQDYGANLTTAELSKKVLSGTVGKNIDTRITNITTEIGNAHRTTSDTLAARFEEIETGATTTRGDVDKIITELAMTNQAGAIQDTNTRIDTIEKNVLEMGKEIGMISDNETITSLSDTVVRDATRIDALAQEVNEAHISTAVKDANDENRDFGTLDARFEDLETRAGVLESDLNTADIGLKAKVTTLEGKTATLEGTTATGAVKYGDILNSLENSSDERKPLDSRAGYALNRRVNTLESTVGDSLTNSGLVGAVSTIAGRVTTIAESLGSYATTTGAIANAFNDINSKIGSGFDTTTNTVTKAVTDINAKIGGNYDSTNTVAADITAKTNAAKAYTDEKITATTAAYTEADATNLQAAKDYTDEKAEEITTAYEAADTALDGRLDTVEGILNDAKASTVADTTYDNLDARLEAIESHAATADTTASGLREDVNKIANELSMLDNDTITDIGTRIDNITDEINAAHRQLVDENEEPIADSLDKRFDDIEARANTLEGQNLNTRVTTLESTVNHETTGLTATKAIADANKTAIGDENSGLMGRVHTLETQPKSATTIVEKERIVYNESGVPTVYTAAYNEQGTNTPITPSNEVDYLFETEVGDEVKYFYWKYIDNKWELISGGGGSGTGSSSGEFAASLEAIENPDPNVDYFVGNGTDGYTHWRYRVVDSVGSFVRILPNNVVVNGGVDANGGLYAYTINNSDQNIFGQFNAIKGVISQPGTDSTTDLIFTDTHGETTTINIKGGGSGTMNTSYPRLTNTTGSLNILVPETQSAVILSARPDIYQDGIINKDYRDTPLTIYTQYRYNTLSNWTNFNSGELATPSEEYSINVGSLLSVGQTMYVRLLLQVTLDDTVYERNIQYTLNKVEMSIRANGFDQSAIRKSDFRFAYTLIGSNLSKVVHFEVDGNPAVEPFTTTSHNDYLTQTISIDDLTDGMHSLRVYFTVDDKPSNVLNYYFITSTDSTRMKPLVALAAEKDSITYGDELKINYTVASADSRTTTDKINLTLYTIENGQEKEYAHQEKTDEANNIVDVWSVSNYPLKGQAYVRIEASNIIDEVEYTQAETITINIAELEISYDDYGYQGEEALVYSYNAYGRTNNDLDKEEYTYLFNTQNVSATKTNVEIPWTGKSINFNWSGNGYLSGDNALTISGDAYHTINVPIFQTTFDYNDDEYLLDSEARTSITKKGRTIEIEYEVEAAANLNATIMDFSERDKDDNITSTRLKVTPQYCYLLSAGSNIDIDDSGFIINESDVAAAYLTPGVRTHLTFVIEAEADSLAFDRQYHQSVNIYVNGEFANTCPYKKTSQLVDDFSTSATLRIGNSDCVVKLYQIKMYNRALSHREVLQNYKMAPPVTLDKLSRYADNDILDSDYKVEYAKAIKKYNCLLLVGPEPKYGYTTKGEKIVLNPTVSPYKGYPSPANRTDKKTGEVVGKTESGLVLTKPRPDLTEGYIEEFHLTDTIPTDQNISIPAYIGQRGAYCSSNNVQGTSSQKYPIHNLKVYLAKWNKIYTRDQVIEKGTEIPEGTKTEVVTYKHVPHTNDDGYDLVEVEEGETLPDGTVTEQVTYSLKYTTGEIKKVKYSLHGYDDNGEALGSTESTLCWKADYMSTDHANTYNANIADGLFPTTPLKGAAWDSTHQNTVNGIRCLLFQQQGDNPPEFLGDGCLNNDKGNNKTYSLERKGDDDPADGNDTASQKFEFTNNSDDLGYFKTDTLFKVIGETKYIIHTVKTAIEESSIPSGTEVTNLEVGELAPSGDRTVTEEEYNETETGESYVKESIKVAQEDNQGQVELVDQITYYLLNITKEIETEGHYQAKDAFESTYPDEGDLKDGGNEPNYNHLQVLSTWVSKRANYWDETNTAARAAKKEIFRNEFSRHINLDHALVYYIFCEYTAMADNRVKNMFFRTDNCRSEKIYNTTGDLILDGNNEPSALWSNYVKADGTTDATYIDWTRDTFCEWAPVLYDLDSCFGTENVGYLRIRYDADWTYQWNSLPQFNGYESRLWLMFADTFDSEIRAKAKVLYDRADGLNYVNFYNSQVADNLNNISPALSNQDMLIKFDKPWSEGFINYSLAEPKKETPEYKYLQRGSRAAQKTQFMSLRSKLLSSKYGAKEFTNDAIKFRTGRPVGASTTIIDYKKNENNEYITDDSGNRIPIYADGDLSETEITVTVNQTLYPGVAYGDNKDPTRYLQNGGKIAAGTSCTIRATSAVQGNDGLFIYGASAITDIGDISRFCPYQLDLSAGANLKRLIVGSHREGYVNNGTNSFINLGSCTLLEEMNIENCIALTSTLDLSNIPLIKHVYATGSKVPTILFPDGGVLETIEYGSSTTSINIRNQPRLINFSYEGNDYSALKSLLIENTPNVPIVDIINNNMQNLVNGIRLIGIDVNLGDNPTFLQKITSELAVGKYMTASGSCPPGNKQVPIITGHVQISTIRSSLLAKVGEMYPNLIVTATKEETENTINYFNYDQTTLLYTDYHINGENIIDPVYDTNPVTGNTYISMPEKPEDAEFKYKFGTYDNDGKYNRFSGWVEKGTTTHPTAATTVSGDKTYVAYYPTTEDQLYTVKWFDESRKLDEVTVKYNTDLSAYSSPADKDNGLARTGSSGNTYRVFKGWDKPLGKITHDVNVYAQWESSSINDNTSSIEMDTLTAADLFALTQVNVSTLSRLLSDKLGTPILVPIGQEFDYDESVTDLRGNSNILLDGSQGGVRVYNDIKPLLTNSDWTFAIDYKFNMVDLTAGVEYVLASCYQNANDSIQGFKISLFKSDSGTTGSQTHTIQVSWGTVTTTVDYAMTDSSRFVNYRNIIVLSHNSSRPNQLRVSYMQPDISNTYASVGSTYGTYVNHRLLIYNNISINKPLIIGGNQVGTSTEIESSSIGRVPAQATVYWAKFWNTDLGETNCGKIASWIHETIPFYLSGFNGTNQTTNKSEQIYENSKLSFVAAQGLGDRYIYTDTAYQYITSDETVKDTDDNGYVGWHISNARKVCQELVYNALPESYKSVIKPTTVRYIKHDPTANTGTGVRDIVSDYIFLPAYREVISGTIDSQLLQDEIQNSWTNPWSWMVPANRSIYRLAQNSQQNLVAGTASSINIFLYRFAEGYITDTARIFSVPSDPANLFRLNNGTTSVVPVDGDIWIDSTSNVAYMYYSNNTIEEKGIVTDRNAVNDNGITIGGWKSAELWNLRTINLNSAMSNENIVMRVKATGDVVIPGTRNEDRGVGRLLCPEFTV